MRKVGERGREGGGGREARSVRGGGGVHLREGQDRREWAYVLDKKRIPGEIGR